MGRELGCSAVPAEGKDGAVGKGALGRRKAVMLKCAEYLDCTMERIRSSPSPSASMCVVVSCRCIENLC